MSITVLSFGQIATVTGNNIALDEAIADTEGLKNFLQKKFPALAGLNYAIAVDKKLVHENISLVNATTVALLPPFSGG